MLAMDMAMLNLFRTAFHVRVSLVMGVAQNGWFRREHPINMDDLGVSPFQETTMFTFWISPFGRQVVCSSTWTILWSLKQRTTWNTTCRVTQDTRIHMVHW